MSRRGSRGSGNLVWVPKGESPVTADRSLNESSGNRGSGSRGRGRSRTSSSPRTSSEYANDEPIPVQVNKSSQVSNVDEIGSTKKPDDSTPSNCSGYYNKDHLQSPASSNSKSLNFSGCENKDVSGTHCDPLNEKGDVSLSFQESVACTRDQKVVNSSVEGHNSAHKSWNEHSARPFDLFFRSKAMGLKPSLLELNREKKKETKGYSGIVIRPGMVLLKNYLSINDQVMIVNKCRQLGLGEGGFYQPGYSDGAKLRLQMMCLGKDWDPQTSKYGETRLVDGSVPPQIPVEFSQLVGNAIKESQSLVAKESKIMKGEDEIPSMSPDVCIVNFYTSTGRLGLHQDKDESKYSLRKGLPVVSFSIGDSAEFLFGDQRDDERAKTLVLESGDVLLFGGESRNVFHGVSSIHKDTAPKVLVHETGLRPGRLNLTFRKY